MSFSDFFKYFKQVNVTGGAANVYLGKSGASRNRNIAAAATTHPGNDSTNSATWQAGDNVTELRIMSVSSVADQAVNTDEYYLVVINAVNGADALTLLTDAGGLGTDVEYEIGVPLQELIINRTTPITRIDVLPQGVGQRFVIGAV